MISGCWEGCWLGGLRLNLRLNWMGFCFFFHSVCGVDIRCLKVHIYSAHKYRFTPL